MTIYDAVMAALVVAGMVWGAWRGIIWQVASISSLVLGYAVSHQLSPQLAPHFPGEPVVARAEAMLAIYAAVSGGIFLAAWMVRSTLRKLRFEAFDRHLGMVMGGIEGALLGLVGTLFVVSLDQPLRAPIFASPTGQIVSRVMDSVGPVLPDEARQALAPFWNSTRRHDRGGDRRERTGRSTQRRETGEPDRRRRIASRPGDRRDSGKGPATDRYRQ